MPAIKDVAVNYKRIVPGLLLAVVLAYGLLSQIRLGQVAAAFASLRPQVVLVAAGVLIAMNLVKAWRFHDLLDGDIAFVPLIPIVVLHNFFIGFMPSRSGEVAYLVLLKRRFDLPVSRSLPTLVIARVLDVAIILILVLGTIGVAFRDRVRALSGLLPLLFLAAGGLVALLLLLVYRAGRLHQVLNTFLGGHSRGRIASKLLETVEAFQFGFSRSHLLQIIGYTVFIWLLTFAADYVLYRGLGLPVSYGQFVVVSLFPLLTHIIPVQSFAAIGTYEATIGGGFALMGFPPARVLPLTFTVHLVQLTFTSLFGLAGYLWFHAGRPKAV